MERVSPTAYLSVLICVLVADLAAIVFLHWQRKRLGLKELFRQLQTWLTIAKSAFDTALVVLMVLYTLKVLDDSKQRLARTPPMSYRLIDPFRGRVLAYC